MNEWKEFSLEKFTDFFNGKSIKPSKFGSYLVYGSNGVIGFSNNFLYNDGIIIGRVGANCGSVELSHEKFWPSDNTIVVKSKINSELRYVYYLLKNFPLNSLAGGSAQPLLTQSVLKTIKFFLPPLPIQKRIASILSSYDDLIENNLRRIKLLEEIAQRTYEEWFVKFRINGEQLPLDENTGLPEGWEYKRADEVFNIKIGKTPPREQEQWFSENTGIKWASIKDINNASVFISETSERITEDAVEKFNMNVAGKGTVILSFKLTVGKVTITTENMVTNEAIAHFNSAKNMPKSFIFCYLKGFNYERLGSTSSIGTAINSKIVKSIPFLIPIESELLKFSKIAEPIFDKLEILLSENRFLKESRDLLLPRLMNGTITVD